MEHFDSSINPKQEDSSLPQSSMSQYDKQYNLSGDTTRSTCQERISPLFSLPYRIIQ